MYTYTQYCRRFVFEGNELLKFSAKYPLLDQNNEINEFYKSLAQKCELFCEQNKFFELCESFKKDKEEQKFQIDQRYTYIFDAQISAISEEFVSILLSVNFYRSKNNPILFFSDEQTWSLIDNMMLRADKK